MPQRPPEPTLLYRAYRALVGLALPLAWAVVARKLARAGVTRARARERLGHAGLPRPEGRLIWFHAASVGESLSVLSLIARLGENLPRAQFLITSGTATSAALIAKRLPPRARHQFAPLDAPRVVRRFLRHWRPDAAVFVESELWPVLLVETRASGARLALLNARLSARSARAWARHPKTARFLLDRFALIRAQNDQAAARLRRIGADPARLGVGGNLKSAAAPLPVDDTALAAIRAALGGRPLWAASSTHPGEEEIVLQAHARLRARWPDLCLLLIPRHPERGGELAELVRRSGFDLARRAAGEPLAGQAVYLADTLGETGTWYALAPFVFLGGSLTPVGGHNPYEPAQAGAAVITGPHVTNFSESFAPLLACGGAVAAGDAATLAAAAAAWLGDGAALARARAAARGFVADRAAALDALAGDLIRALELEPKDG